MTPARDLFEIQIRVADFRDAKLAQQRVAFAHDVDIVAIAEKRALGSAVGNRPVAKKLHVARQRRRWWRRLLLRSDWRTRCHSNRLRIYRRRRRNLAE